MREIGWKNYDYFVVTVEIGTISHTFKLYHGTL